MKKVIRLTESDLTRIVKRIINESQDPISKFTEEELEKISRMVINMSQPEFFEDYEARNYLYYEVAKKDKKLYDSLVKWIMDNKKGFDTRNL
jgi:hypothetical protein